jgi:hypothetical protein
LPDDKLVNAVGFTSSFRIDGVDEDTKSFADGRQVAQMEGWSVTRGIIPEFGRVTFEHFEDKMLREASIMTLITTQFH